MANFRLHLQISRKLKRTIWCIMKSVTFMPVCSISIKLFVSFTDKKLLILQVIKRQSPNITQIILVKQNMLKQGKWKIIKGDAHKQFLSCFRRGKVGWPFWGMNIVCHRRTHFNPLHYILVTEGFNLQRFGLFQST